MVEIAAKVLVKEERRPEVISTMAPLQSSSSNGLQALYFNVFDLRLRE
jgi:hypothetical protein